MLIGTIGRPAPSAGRTERDDHFWRRTRSAAEEDAAELLRCFPFRRRDGPGRRLRGEAWDFRFYGGMAHHRITTGYPMKRSANCWQSWTTAKTTLSTVTFGFQKTPQDGASASSPANVGWLFWRTVRQAVSHSTERVSCASMPSCCFGALPMVRCTQFGTSHGIQAMGRS
jgi:hypothetical protein